MNYIEYVKANPKLATMKESTRYPGLFVLKYKRNVFYDNLWDDHLIEMRGRVVDASGETVIAPFTKIFNRHENGTDIDRDEDCLVIDKINGFMAAMTYIPSIDEVVISTTGSLDSEFVELAEKHLGHLRDKVRKAYDNLTAAGTFLFEIVDETDPHIIKETTGAYLIGYRRLDEKIYVTNASMERSLDLLADGWGVMRPWWMVERFSDTVKRVKAYTREGVVVYGMTSGTSLKMKTPFYLMSKFLGRMRGEKFDLLADNRERFRATVKDEEFFPLVDYLIDHRIIFSLYSEQQKIKFVQDFIEQNV